jgi:3-hydroxyisobutyrate dehydrogenase
MAAASAQAPIGVVGVGNMGSGIVRRLLHCGHDVVVRDIRADSQAAAVAAGARAAPDAATLAHGCELLIVVVVDATQCNEALFGDGGAHGGLHARSTVLLCPTLAPHEVESLAARLSALGVPCIDAPMSGGPQRAGDGTMSLMVACADILFARHESVLRELSSRLLRVGTRLGDGARTKLVNNLLAAVNLAGAAEAVALAERLGLDARRTQQVIEQSSGQSWIGSDRMPRALAGDFEPRAHASLLAKDTTLALTMAHGVGVQPLLGTAAHALFAQACATGLQTLDDASMLTLMRRLFEPERGQSG